MQKPTPERRKYSRFETDAKIQFRVTFDIKTKVDFKIRDNAFVSSQTYSGISSNASVEGLAFHCEKSLLAGDLLALEIYVPSADKPVSMEGVVRWCQPTANNPQIFNIGVLITKVKNNLVSDSITIDSEHQIVWSIVLESIFGNFKHLVNSRKVTAPTQEGIF